MFRYQQINILSLKQLNLTLIKFIEKIVIFYFKFDESLSNK